MTIRMPSTFLCVKFSYLTGNFPNFPIQAKSSKAWGSQEFRKAAIGNFELCVTNFDKISFFSLRSRYGKFRGFHPSYIIRSVSDLQNPTATPLTQAGAAHIELRGTRLSAAHTITERWGFLYDLGGGPIRYVSCCIVMYCECIL